MAGRREEGTVRKLDPPNEVYLVLVIQTPFVKGDKVELEPVVDPRS